jgi:hypothetical protein
VIKARIEAADRRDRERYRAAAYAIDRREPLTDDLRAELARLRRDMSAIAADVVRDIIAEELPAAVKYIMDSNRRKAFGTPQEYHRRAQGQG